MKKPLTQYIILPFHVAVNTAGLSAIGPVGRAALFHADSAANKPRVLSTVNGLSGSFLACRIYSGKDTVIPLFMVDNDAANLKPDYCLLIKRCWADEKNGWGSWSGLKVEMKLAYAHGLGRKAAGTQPFANLWLRSYFIKDMWLMKTYQQ